MPHYFTSNAPKEITRGEIQTILLGNSVTFHTESGIFSINKVDKGTEVLVTHCQIPNNALVLDLGCGYGAVGIAIAKAHFDARIECCDINMRAVNICKKNIAKNQLTNIKVYHSDIYSKVRDKFDVILTNPPFSAGRAICYAFIDGAKKHLKLGGSLQLVAPHQKGGKMLEKRMHEVFGNVEIIGKKSGYRVYRSVQIV